MLEMMTGSLLKKIAEPGLEINPGVFEKLLTTDGVVSTWFSYSVAVSADGLTIVAAAPYDRDKGSQSGSVYIFTKQANRSYLQTQKLLALDGVANDAFGYSVSVSADGSTIAVGASGDDDKGRDSGSVYIYKKQINGTYLQTQKLLTSDGKNYECFGNSVSVSADGSTIAVGAFLDGSIRSKAGSVYIFTKQANGDYLQAQKLVASDGFNEDEFGKSVSVSGDGSIVVIGAHEDDDRSPQSGSAYIFTKQANGSYVQTQKLLAADRSSSYYFGNSVSVSGDGLTIVVGARGAEGYRGSAYIFTKQTNGSYLETHKLVALDRAFNDEFGKSVAISLDGSTIVVGAYYDDDKGKDSGSAYIFTKQDDGSYLQTHKLVATDGVAGDYFGFSVAISNTSVAVGAYNHLTKGAVYVY